jgi:hypothetical protein
MKRQPLPLLLSLVIWSWINLFVESSFPTNAPIQKPTRSAVSQTITAPLEMNYRFDGDSRSFQLKNSATNSYDAALIPLSSSGFDYYEYAAGSASLYLDGGGYVTLPSFAFSNNGLTVTFWVKSQYLTQYSVYPSPIFEFGIGPGYYGMQFLFTLSQGPIFSGLSTIPSYLYDSYPIYDGEWHFVACTLSGTSYDTYISYYVDGQFIYSSSVPASYRATMIRNTNYLARSDFMPGYGFIGRIDEFRVYDGVLTGSDISSLYTGPSDPTFNPTRAPTLFKTSSSSSSAGVIVSIVFPIVGFVAFGIFAAVRAAQRRNQFNVVSPQQQGITYANLNSAPGGGGMQMSAYPQATAIPAYGGSSYPTTSLGAAPFSTTPYQPQTNYSRVDPHLPTHVHNASRPSNPQAGINYSQLSSSQPTYSSVPSSAPVTSTFPQYQSPNSAVPWGPPGATTTTAAVGSSSNPYGQSSAVPSANTQLDRMVENFFNPQPVAYPGANANSSTNQSHAPTSSGGGGVFSLGNQGYDLK